MLAKVFCVLLVMAVVGVRPVQGACGDEGPSCVSAFTSSCVTFSACCSAIDPYVDCLKTACDELAASAIDDLANQHLGQYRAQCGSSMIYISGMHVMIVAIVAVFFNSRA